MVSHTLLYAYVPSVSQYKHTHTVSASIVDVRALKLMDHIYLRVCTRTLARSHRPATTHCAVCTRRVVVVADVVVIQPVYHLAAAVALEVCERPVCVCVQICRIFCKIMTLLTKKPRAHVGCSGGGSGSSNGVDGVFTRSGSRV